jgi:hypothetical protein
MSSNELKGLIYQMLKPLKGISLNLIIEGISGYPIIPFDYKNEKDLILLESLKQIAILTTKKINISGINKNRPNEAGNEAENFLKEAMFEISFKPTTQLTKSGKHKSSGYPDIEFIDEFGRINYLECKTFNSGSENSSFRSFFVSPSEDFKITTNAHHLMIALELFQDIHKGTNVFKCKSWKIICLAILYVM